MSAAVGQHLVEPVGSPRDQRDGVATARQLSRDGGADARRRAGHEDRAAVAFVLGLTFEPPPRQSRGLSRRTANRTTAHFGVSEGSRTPDLQDHNLAL